MVLELTIIYILYEYYINVKLLMQLCAILLHFCLLCFDLHFHILHLPAYASLFNSHIERRIDFTYLFGNLMKNHTFDSAVR